MAKPYVKLDVGASGYYQQSRQRPQVLGAVVRSAKPLTTILEMLVGKDLLGMLVLPPTLPQLTRKNILRAGKVNILVEVEAGNAQALPLMLGMR